MIRRYQGMAFVLILWPILVIAKDSQTDFLSQSKTTSIIEDVRDLVPIVKSYPQTSAIKAEELFPHVQFLADDQLTGRYPGTEGIEYAARYLADRFAEYGLAPIGDNASYFQNFEFIGEVKLGEPNELTIQSDTGLHSLMVKTDFIPLAFAKSEIVTGEVVFVGYGLSVPDKHYDDYADIAVKDKILLMFRAMPGDDNPQNPLQRHASLRHKLVVAREKGAKAVLLVTGMAQENQLNELVPFKTDFAFKDSGIAALSISRTVANQILAAVDTDLTQLQKTIDDSFQPNSFPIPAIQIRLKTVIKNQTINTRNVVSFWPGQTEKTIVIGAHYDHIGLGGNNSLDANPGVIHNGADDNASGVAGLLELAHYFSTLSQPLQHSLLFVAFSAEEFGTIGSKYFINHPLKPLKNMIAMINMDMIGHLRNNKLVVQGVGTSPIWEPLLDSVNAHYPFKLAKQKDGPGPSDQNSFYSQDIPVLAFFTGAHSYYNRSTDDYWRLNYQGQEKIVQFVRDVILKIEPYQKITFARAESQHQYGKQQGGFKVTLGVVPDYAFSSRGLRLDVVKQNRPAYKAGLQRGDIIIQFGSITVNNIYDYMVALRQFKPNEQVQLTFIRKGHSMTTQVLLQ